MMFLKLLATQFVSKVRKFWYDDAGREDLSEMFPKVESIKLLDSHLRGNDSRPGFNRLCHPMFTKELYLGKIEEEKDTTLSFVIKGRRESGELYVKKFGDAHICYEKLKRLDGLI